MEVSAHFLIRRDGTVIQFVPFTERAWHAGESCFRGQPAATTFPSASNSRARMKRRTMIGNIPVLQAVVKALVRCLSWHFSTRDCWPL